MNKLKFKFNYQQNTLAYQKDKLWYHISEENQFLGNFGSLGFKLNQGWISFKVYVRKISVFYKQTRTLVTYFRKDLPKECPVIFTFTEKDEVEKINGAWRSKHA